MRTARGIMVACLLLVVPACMSNNKGKILGKWQYVDGTVAFVPPGVSVVIEFTAAGKSIWTFAGPGGSATITADYSLGFGNSVTFSNFNPPLPAGQKMGRDDIIINGNDMTMKEPDGKIMRFKRV